MEKTTASSGNLLWYKDAIIYELHIKAFYDSNGDGIGDFGGLLQKLDYLQDLGVTAVWVLPFYPSPLRDDGYDIADYYNINPRYGTLEQFQQFLAEAHKRNLKVITELVINHTSDQHPWFQRARTAPKVSKERDYYVWSDDPAKYDDVRIIFTDYEKSNWTWDPVAGQYYWHRFFHHQPDLNYDSEDVQAEIFKIIDYWCAMGVDGFRLDAVPYLYEREGTNGENLPETHAFLKRLRAHVDEKFPGICFLAEANMWPEDSAAYFGNGDECHMNYHFPVMPRMFMALQREDRYPITDIFDQTPAVPENCQWAMFLRNHDELTLEMVTDEERDFMYTVYAKDPKARINLGIRHRLAPLMENDRRRIELMNSLLFSLPGTPVIYYGDELGMGDNVYLGDRDGVRTPMQWSPDRNAGFSATNPQRLYLPVILDPQYHYETVNVETQRASRTSLFWFMKRIMALRKKYRAFSRGDIKFLYVDNPKILAFTRSFEGETLLIVANLSKYAQPAEMDLKAFKGYVPIEVFSKNDFPAIKESTPYFFTLAPHSFQWFHLQEAKAASPAKHTQLNIGQWEELFTGDALSRLQNDVLPAYIQSADWFVGKDKDFYSATVMAHTALPVGEGDAEVLLIEVAFESGLPEYYQLPLIFLPSDGAQKISETHPIAMVAQLTISGRDGYLCDAVYTTVFQQAILKFLAEGKRFMGSGEILFTAAEAVQSFIANGVDASPFVKTTSELHTSIVYNNDYFLKIYRRVDNGLHPDVELTRYLTQQAEGRTTKYAGEISWQFSDGIFTLGLLEKLEENHGDGHRYMLERVANFTERILSGDKATLATYPKAGSLFSPLAFTDLPDGLKQFLGPGGAEHARLTGLQLAQVHKALAAGTQKEFLPEEFSLHYQRSLFSSMVSLVREMTQAIEKNTASLSDDIREEVWALGARREIILSTMKKVYSKKFDVLKIRTHGNFGLTHVLLTGADVLIHDFGGNPLKPFSERRLKRSPLRDVAAAIRSFYYVAYEGFLNSTHIRPEEQKTLLPFADFWAQYMSNFFMKAYRDETKGIAFIPDDVADFQILLQSFLLENALHWFNYEMAHRPERVVIPLRIVQGIIE